MPGIPVEPYKNNEVKLQRDWIARKRSEETLTFMKEATTKFKSPTAMSQSPQLPKIGERSP